MSMDYYVVNHEKPIFMKMPYVITNLTSRVGYGFIFVLPQAIN
jgi:hypothetical protein